MIFMLDRLGSILNLHSDMSEKFTFDTNLYPNMAKIAPSGEFVGGIGIVIDAANTLTNNQEIVDFSRELTEWLSALRSQGDEPTIVGGWISYVVGHFGSDVEQRWQRALPQADMATGFMPEGKTLRISYMDSEDLRNKLINAGKFVLGQ